MLRDNRLKTASGVLMPAASRAVCMRDGSVSSLAMAWDSALVMALITMMADPAGKVIVRDLHAHGARLGTVCSRDEPCRMNNEICEAYVTSCAASACLWLVKGQPSQCEYDHKPGTMVQLQ